MFKKITTLSFALAALTTGGQAMAEYYVGGNISSMKVEHDFVSDSADLVALYGRLGTEFTENFSAEIRVGTGIDDDTVNVLGTPVKLELNHFYGAYLRGTLPVTDTFYPYAVVGFTRAELEAKASGVSDSDSGSDVSFGLGADIRLTSNTDLNLEYMNYYDKDDLAIDGFSVGFTYRFY